MLAGIRVREFSVVLVLVLFVSLLLMIPSGSAGARPAAGEPGAVGPFPVTTIYTNLTGHPLAEVPGYPGIYFNIVPGFISLNGSPNGNWILEAATTRQPSINNGVLLVNGEVKFFSGDPAPWTGGVQHVTVFGLGKGINDSGEWVFAPETNLLVNLPFNFVIHVSPSDVYTVLARESDPVPHVPGATWGRQLDFPVITADGTAGWDAGSINGVPVTEDDILVLGDELLAQQGVTAPLNQVGNEYWEDFFGFFVSADGTHWLVNGDLTGDSTTDDVIVVDGAVVVQEGVILPGSGYSEPVASIFNNGSEFFMAPNGDWFVHGFNTPTAQSVTGHDWVIRNGVVIAETGAPIYVGATEVYTDTIVGMPFFTHVGDSFGNYVLSGTTDNDPSLVGEVLVLNNQTVIARTGDPVDLDNNGVFDDGVYFSDFRGASFLDDNGDLYIIAGLSNELGHRYEGMFMIDLSSGLPGGNSAPVCGTAAPSKSSLWPPNHKFNSISILGVTDPDGDSMTTTITGIRQDEAVNAPNSGNTSPDGKGVGTSTAQVRAERVANGNGRVYHISFTVTDIHGSSCSGEVLVGVPKSISSGPAVDEGALYDSTAQGEMRRTYK